MLGPAILRWTKFLYVLASPIIKACKWPQVSVTSGAFMKFLVQKVESSVVYQKVFTTAQQLLPESLKREMTIKRLTTKFKSAGTMSNQRSAAATAWIMNFSDQLHKLPFASAGE